MPFSSGLAQDATRTSPDGKLSSVEYVFIRGSQIVFIIFPDMLRRAPMFKRIKVWKKFKGHPPAGMSATGPRGQAAAIIRKGKVIVKTFIVPCLSSQLVPRRLEIRRSSATTSDNGWQMTRRPTASPASDYSGSHVSGSMAREEEAPRCDSTRYMGTYSPIDPDSTVEVVGLVWFWLFVNGGRGRRQHRWLFLSSVVYSDSMMEPRRGSLEDGRHMALSGPGQLATWI